MCSDHIESRVPLVSLIATIHYPDCGGSQNGGAQDGTAHHSPESGPTTIWGNPPCKVWSTYDRYSDPITCFDIFVIYIYIYIYISFFVLICLGNTIQMKFPKTNLQANQLRGTKNNNNKQICVKDTSNHGPMRYTISQTSSPPERPRNYVWGELGIPDLFPGTTIINLASGCDV